jgi:hypothetical protein
MQVAFGTAAIGPGAWARIAAAAVLAGGVVSLEKRLRRRPVV